MEIQITNPKVSAIVCAYNEEKTIRNVMQVLVDHPLISEVIAIDDGSQDQTGIIMGGFQNPESVQAIILPENKGKGYAMATAVEKASGDVLLFVDADLINLSDQHISSMLGTFFKEEPDMLIGFPIRGETISSAEKLDPFQQLSGQRVMYRQDFLPLLDTIRCSGYGVETILNQHFEARKKPVKSIFLLNLIHPIKIEKSGFRRALVEYSLEGKQIIKTRIKNLEQNWDLNATRNSTAITRGQNKIYQSFFEISKKIVRRPMIIFSEQIPMDEPVVFVANHEKNYGPSIMQLFFPIPYRPWIIHNMLDGDECRTYVQKTFFEQRIGLPSWISNLVAKIIAPFLVKLMHVTNPVPVYRENRDQTVMTFRQSMEILNNGENLLIFPENGEAGNFSPDIRNFFDGFIYLAKLYNRETKKCLSFCPVSINPKSQVISVGRIVRFNPQIDYKLEAERINLNLMQQVADLYHKPWLTGDQRKKDSYQRNLPDLQPKFS